MASITRDGRSGNWIVMFRWNGRQIRRSTGTGNKRDAELVRARVEETLRLLKLGRLEMPADADAGTWLMSDGKVARQQPHAVQFGVICDEYLGSQQDKAESTLAGEHIHVRHLKRLLGTQKVGNEISLRNLQHYANERLQEMSRGRRISGKTVRKELTTFRQIWGWAKRQKFVQNPCPLYDDNQRWAVSIPKPVERERFQTWDQIERRIARGGLSDLEIGDLWDSLFLDEKQVVELLQHFQQHAKYAFVHPMVAFAAYTGARRGEILRSLIDDFDFEGGQVRIRERKRRKNMAQTFRFVPLHPKLVAVMQAWFEQHPGGAHTITMPLSICKKKVRPSFDCLTVHEAHHHFKHSLKNSKWNVVRGFHVLRHSFGSNLARSGKVPRDTIARWMGHTTEEMKDHYQHLFPQDGQSQIEVLV